MSSSLTLSCLPSVKKHKHEFYLFCSMYNKQLFDSVFVISRIMKVSIRVIGLLGYKDYYLTVKKFVFS